MGAIHVATAMLCFTSLVRCFTAALDLYNIHDEVYVISIFLAVAQVLTNSLSRQSICKFDLNLITFPFVDSVEI